MRSRRSLRAQDRLFNDISRQIRAAAVQREADPAVYACPDGSRCLDPECVAENARRRSA
jgi:hypothetical protein